VVYSAGRDIDIAQQRLVGFGQDAQMNRVIGSIVLLPRNVGVLVLRAYRAVISPLYGDVCRYYPSCSAYALGAVQEHGLVIGSALTARRLARCHPWAEGGIDDVPLRRKRRYSVTRFGFVFAPSHGKG
jgi:putative membrane protein insertion efficiency factor